MQGKEISLFLAVALAQVVTLVVGCDITLGNVSCTCQNSTLLCNGVQTGSTDDLISAIVNASIAHRASVTLENILINVENLTLNPTSSLEEMDLQNLTLRSGLMVLPDNLFVEVFDSLTSVNIQNNSFQEIPGNALHILHRLKHLDLSFNNITTITKDDFDGLKTLKTLILENNSIRNIDGEAFSLLENLEYLSLEANEIQQLGLTVFDNLHHLTFLSLSHNKLQALEPETFTQLSSLLRLHIDYNHFLHLQNISFSSKSLVHLSAVYCPIQGSITHSDLRNLPHLETLDLTFNRLNLIEEFALSSLQHLKILNLSHSSIRALEENAFASLVNLEELDLSHSSLFIIRTGAFYNLTKLIHLDLSHNKLGAFLCQYTSDLLALQHINLEENGMKFIEAGAFLYSLDLRSINLKGNSWNCTCLLSQFAEYLRNSTIIDKTDMHLITCSDPRSHGIAITDADYQALNCHTPSPCRSLTFTTTEDALSTTTTGTSTVDKSFTTATTTLFTPRVNESLSSTISSATTTPLSNTNTTDISTSSESVLNSLPVTSSSVATVVDTLESINETTSESLSTTTLTPATSTPALFIFTTVPRYASNPASTGGTLTTHGVKERFEVLIEDHSYTDGNFCVELILNGTLPTERLLCILSYTFPTPSPSSPTHADSNKKIRFKCPAISNQLKKECLKLSKVDVMHEFCIQVFKQAGRQLLANSCLAHDGKTSFDNPASTSPYATKNTTDSLVYTTLPINDTTITTTIPPTTSTTLFPTTTTTVSPTTTTIISPTTDTTISPTTNTTLPPTTDTTLPPTSRFSALITIVTTVPAATIINVTTSIINILDKSTPKIKAVEPFNITYLNFNFINETALKMNWEVIRKEPKFACHLLLEIWNENSNPTNLTFPCEDNTQVIGGLRKQDDYKMCITAFHITFGVIRICHPILSVSQEYSIAAHSQSSFFTLPTMVLIGLLILIILVVAVLVTRNILRKPVVSDRYNVSAEEKRVQIRENRNSETPSVRYSYIASETV